MYYYIGNNNSRIKHPKALKMYCCFLYLFSDILSKFVYFSCHESDKPKIFICGLACLIHTEHLLCSKNVMKSLVYTKLNLQHSFQQNK